MDLLGVVLRNKQSCSQNSSTFYFIHGKGSNCKTLSLLRSASWSWWGNCHCEGFSLEERWQMSIKWEARRSGFQPWLCCLQPCILDSLVAQTEKNLPAMQETCIPSLGWEDALEKGMATHSSILAWESQGQRSLVGYSPWGHKELDKTERLTHACTHHTSLGKALFEPQFPH